jgi:subtilisin family serine protease
VVEGVSVFVSSGDEGAAIADINAPYATHGIAVSGFTSTPYNVSVGGTDFGDTYSKTASTHWSSTNRATYGSALSYVPEIPWDDSCASSILAAFEGYASPFGANGFCNSLIAEFFYLDDTAGSGGPSGCATGAPSTADVVSGTCAGYSKPSWQSIVGNPSDGVRDILDVSLFAAKGLWNHYYVACYSDPNNGGTACSGTPDTWSGFGGTSISSPIMAGIQALINQRTGSRQGNPNPTYYAPAAVAGSDCDADSYHRAYPHPDRDGDSHSSDSYCHGCFKDSNHSRLHQRDDVLYAAARRKLQDQCQVQAVGEGRRRGNSDDQRQRSEHTADRNAERHRNLTRAQREPDGHCRGNSERVPARSTAGSMDPA